MDLSSLRRAYTGHVPDLMGARGGSAVLVPPLLLSAAFFAPDGGVPSTSCETPARSMEDTDALEGTCVSWRVGLPDGAVGKRINRVISGREGDDKTRSVNESVVLDNSSSCFWISKRSVFSEYCI